jgi:hypothetical protein
MLLVAVIAFSVSMVALPRLAVAQDTADQVADTTITEFSWPSVIQIDSGLVTIYQPQVDSLTGDRLYSRAAISYTEDDGQPLFGVALFESRVDVDRDSRTVELIDVRVTQARFHGRDRDFRDPLDQLVQSRAPDWDIVLSLDELLTSIAAIEDLRRRTAEGLRMDPPQIVYRDSPALLVSIDGDPVMTEIENSSVTAVINTAYPLLKDGGTYYLNVAADVWYRSSSATGPFTFVASPPSSISQLVPPPTEEELAQSDGPDRPSATFDEPITAANAPGIVVATEPTELIVTEGQPQFEPITGSLSAVSNTESSLFYDTQSLLYYVNLSGRWYQSGSVAGPYSFVEPDALPSDFADIPPDSEYGHVRTFVAGTDEAREAVVDTYIPETAAIERGVVDLDVEYDGEPKFEDIEETDLEYAVNTSDQIIKEGTRFYLVRDGVWYVSDGPNGPWEVSDHAPDAVQDIPPSNPTYTVKYVHVYHTTPTVVYVGYTPGYMGTFVWGPTIVWGTGWWYRPWVTPHVFWPRTPTWGFHVRYNPWTGWSFGMSWGRGPFRISFWSGGHWHRRHPWHRPPHWRRPHVPHFPPRRNRYRASTQRARVAQHGRAAGRSNVPGARPATRPSTRPSTGAADRAATRPSTGGGAARPSTRENNVFAGRDGNVYRRDNSGNWDRNSGGTWNRQGQASTRDRSTTNQLNRQQHSRNRAQTRNNQWQSSSRAGGGAQMRSGRRR